MFGNNPDRSALLGNSARIEQAAEIARNSQVTSDALKADFQRVLDQKLEDKTKALYAKAYGIVIALSKKRDAVITFLEEFNRLKTTDDIEQDSLIVSSIVDSSDRLEYGDLARELNLHARYIGVEKTLVIEQAKLESEIKVAIDKLIKIEQLLTKNTLVHAFLRSVQGIHTMTSEELQQLIQTTEELYLHIWDHLSEA